MVYCGKPSRGCENCRKLHKKCDERRPICGRCLKSNRTCLGYRDQSDLVFRDETTRTRDRFRQWNTRTRDQFFPTLIDRASASVYGDCLTLTHRLSPPVEDAAICYFYQTTMENLSDQDPAHYLHTQLPNLYAISNPGSALRLATEAISYATSTKLVQEATLLSRKRYVQAIKAIGKAIQDPIEARNDQTLYAILLLCGYETILQGPTAPSAWGAHVDGAAALVRFRGGGKVHSSLSRSMFCFVRKSVVLSHMQLCRPVDEIFTVPDEAASSHQSPEDRLTLAAAKIPNLQYRSNYLFSQTRDASKDDIESLLYSATALDRELSHWASSLSPAWSYSAAVNVKDPASSKFTPHQVHRYSSFYSARVWNMYRVSRLIVQSTLVRAISRLPTSVETGTNELDKSKIEESITELVSDICASVPFLLGHDLTRMKLPAMSEVRRHERRSWPRVEENAAMGTGRFSLIWPLYVACGASPTPEAQREWMRMQLRFLAEDGEPQACFVSDVKSQILLGAAQKFRFDCV